MVSMQHCPKHFDDAAKISFDDIEEEKDSNDFLLIEICDDDELQRKDEFYFFRKFSKLPMIAKISVVAMIRRMKMMIMMIVMIMMQIMMMMNAKNCMMVRLILTTGPMTALFQTPDKLLRFLMMIIFGSLLNIVTMIVSS